LSQVYYDGRQLTIPWPPPSPDYTAWSGQVQPAHRIFSQVFTLQSTPHPVSACLSGPRGDHPSDAL